MIQAQIPALAPILGKILHALGQLPYVQVMALIEKIKSQAERGRNDANLS